MKKLSFLICFVFAILLAGCAGSEGQALEAGTTTQTPAPAVTSTPAPRSPTPSSTSAWRIVTATTAPTLSREAQVTPQCLEFASTMPDDAKAEGVVLLEKWVGGYGLERTLLDMFTWQDIPVQPDEKHDYESLVVSPNRRQMTYLTFLESDGIAKFQELVIADAFGKQLKNMPWKIKWTDIVDWIDDQQIMIRMVAMENGEISYGYPGPRLVIDTVNGEQRTLEPDLLPGWEEWIDATYEYVELPFWGGQRGVVYDPSLTRVIYPIINEEDTDRYTYALWDVSQQKPVTTLDSIVNFSVKENYYPRPDWSPDSSQFVLVGGMIDVDTGDVVGNELFRVTRDGQIEQITHVGEFASVWASSHSWSPDGRYIALLLHLNDEASYDARLAVLDTETMNLTDYCFTVRVKFSSTKTPALVWSPDGTQLLLENKFIGDRSQVIWVDLENGTAARLINDEYVAGWMLAPGE